MKKIKPLDYKFLRQILKSNFFKFKTTNELKFASEFLCQERAARAINFGIRIKSNGYNLYAMGSTEIDKRSLIRNYIKDYAQTKKPPADWCYIYNFKFPNKPIALKLPSGIGYIFQKDMFIFIDEIKVGILTIFESNKYQKGMKKINTEFKRKQKMTPKKNIKVVKESIPYLYREKHEREKKLREELAHSVIQPFINKLKTKYAAYNKIINFLHAVEHDIMINIEDFVKKDETTGAYVLKNENQQLNRYSVNLLVNNRNKKGVSVIYEENPSYFNLIGRVEYKYLFGALTTDFTLIKAGALQRANDGFLVIDAEKLVKDKYAWQALKIALITKKIKIEPVEDMNQQTRPISLKPKTIPLKIKIILLGSRKLYYDLSKNDLDFNELFKVVVDFDDTIARNKINIQQYAHLIATLIHRHGLRPFHRNAVAEIIDYSTRLAEDIEKLSTHIRRVEDLVQESNYWAIKTKKKIVEANDVKKAIQAQIDRIDRARELYYEDIARDFILINTKNNLIGQINGLSVLKVGNFSYGHPTRITAQVRMGKGKFIDIQREIDLAGPIHSKAGLILSNFLADRYNKNQLFSLTASIAFEQIYGTIDGDSASVAELCALLSALANVPLKQCLAVTGSINQYGEVQAVGKVNEKIEGFYDICKAKGLTGHQGVIIPAVNVNNLMLREDIVAAAKAKTFFIYPIETIDQAITILTDMPAGEQNQDNKFPKNSFNFLVQNKLIEFTKNRTRTIDDD